MHFGDSKNKVGSVVAVGGMVAVNGKGVAVDHNLFEILTETPLMVWACLASSLQIIFRELFGRANLGEGALKTEGMDIRRFYILRHDVLSSVEMATVREAFHALGCRPIYPLSEEIQKSDRRALDSILFDALGLNKQEREEIYEAVVKLVEQRLEKAESLVRKRKGGK